MAERNAARITVILPTYQRAGVLPLCLQHLERQTFQDFDVIVVDDGSTDETPAVLRRFVEASPLRLRTFRQDNAGPAKARNLALRHTQSPYAILIGDDILAEPDFVERHLRLHEADASASLFVLGRTRWNAEHQELTPFMRWLEHVQFNYRDLDAGATPDWRNFFTSNLSFKTATLQAFPADEACPMPFEDMEWGYRLQSAGMLRMEYHAGIQATHVHPMSFADTARRMRRVGFSEAYFAQHHPEAIGFFARPALKQKLYNFLAAHPRLLDAATRMAARVTKDRQPSTLASGVLMANHRRGWVLFQSGAGSANAS